MNIARHNTVVLQTLTIIQGVRKKNSTTNANGYNVSKRGRTYQPRVAISNDLRNLIISNIYNISRRRSSYRPLSFIALIWVLQIRLEYIHIQLLKYEKIFVPHTQLKVKIAEEISLQS